jgi:WD40 repeat protein
VLSTNNKILATCSADHTIRLWDLRLNSSIKRFTDDKMNNKELSNAKLSPDGNQLFAGASTSIFSFDLRTDKILVEIANKQRETTEEEINFVTLDSDGKFLASCDDRYI